MRAFLTSDSQFGAGLPTPPKRVTGGLHFPGAETVPESVRDWRPSVGGFGGVGRPAPNKKTRAEQKDPRRTKRPAPNKKTRAEQEGAPNQGD
jgi:hypothetical protein